MTAVAQCFYTAMLIILPNVAMPGVRPWIKLSIEDNELLTSIAVAMHTHTNVMVTAYVGQRSKITVDTSFDWPSVINQKQCLDA